MSTLRTTAVASGLERTGRIVTLAAVILSITFFASGTAEKLRNPRPLA